LSVIHHFPKPATLSAVIIEGGYQTTFSLFQHTIAGIRNDSYVEPVLETVVEASLVKGNLIVHPPADNTWGISLVPTYLWKINGCVEGEGVDVKKRIPKFCDCQSHIPSRLNSAGYQKL
jgi:hypothetical protein